MKKILAIGASTSEKSINKILSTYVANLIVDVEVIVVDLNDFELPLYKIDLQESFGIPENAYKFDEMIKQSDGIILSLAEHNGMPSAAFKNLLDWISRIDKNVWKQIPMFLMSCSPGERGGLNVLEIIGKSIPNLGAKIITTFSFPLFYENFSENKITNKILKNKLLEQVKIFETAL